MNFYSSKEKLLNFCRKKTREKDHCPNSLQPYNIQNLNSQQKVKYSTKKAKCGSSGSYLHWLLRFILFFVEEDLEQSCGLSCWELICIICKIFATSLSRYAKITRVVEVIFGNGKLDQQELLERNTRFAHSRNTLK